MPPAERIEPGRNWAVALAVLVHLIFAAVLVFGVSWQTREAAPVTADLWSSLPVPPPKPAPAPRPEPEPAPRPEPKPEPAPVPKPAPKPEQLKPVKADIELKDREKEKEKKRREEEQKKAEEKKIKQAELKRQEAELKRMEQDRQKQEQERLEHERQQQEAARVLASQRASAQAHLMNDAISRISSHIRRFIIMPPDVVGNPQAEFEVSLIPSGEVLNVRLSRSSGNPAYDNAVERAIRKASPLPLPTDATLIGRFRELRLKFRPNE
ncbi:MAG: TonB family protein [Betaproteobacteria bacterium]